MVLEIDETLELKNQEDVDRAIWLLQYHFFQACIRGESLTLTIQTPKPRDDNENELCG